MKLIIDETLKKNYWNGKNKIFAVYLIRNLVNKKVYRSNN